MLALIKSIPLGRGRIAINANPIIGSADTFFSVPECHVGTARLDEPATPSKRIRFKGVPELFIVLPWIIYCSSHTNTSTGTVPW
jgi:hypothetical protein